MTRDLGLGSAASRAIRPSQASNIEAFLCFEGVWAEGGWLRELNRVDCEHQEVGFEIRTSLEEFFGKLRGFLADPPLGTIQEFAATELAELNV